MAGIIIDIIIKIVISMTMFSVATIQIDEYLKICIPLEHMYTLIFLLYYCSSDVNDSDDLYDKLYI